MECARRKTKEQQRKKKESDLIVFDDVISRMSGISDKKNNVNKKREVKASGKKSVGTLPQATNYKKLLGKKATGPLPPLEYDTSALFEQCELD